MLVLIVFFSTLHFLNSKIALYRSDLELFVSQVMRQPVHISTVTLGSSGFEPVFELHNVAILNDANTRVLLYVNELHLGIDLIGSLLQFKIKPGLLAISGANFSIHQNSTGNLRISGIKITEEKHSDFAANEILDWLFDQSKIDLSNITVEWYLADGTIINMVDAHLILFNETLQHNLKITGKLIQDNTLAKLSANISFHGNVLKREIFSVNGDVVVANYLLKLKRSVAKNTFFIGKILPQSGMINLVVKNSSVLSDLFRQKLLVNNLSSKITWENTPKGLHLNFNKLICKDDFMSVRGKLNFLFPPKLASPIAEINLDFRLADLAFAKLYYPVAVLPPRATKWLDQAFTSSKNITGTMILEGPLDRFPFDHDEGRFLIDSTISDVNLHYEAGWPEVANINGKMVFANRSMTITSKSANILHAQIESIKAVIPDLNTPILNIDGTLHSDSSVGLKFVNLSPLKNTIGRKLKAVNLIGPMHFILKMIMPLSSDLKNEPTKINGGIELYDNYLQAYNFGIKNFKGFLHFTENALNADNLSGKLFNKPVQVVINTPKSTPDDTITHVSIHGNANISDIMSGLSINLNDEISGAFNYDMLLELHNSMRFADVLQINSDLQGVTFNLPEPFAKKNTDKHKLKLELYFGDNKISKMNITYGEQISAALKTDAKHLFSGEIKIGPGKAQANLDSGLVISGYMKKLDLALWQDYFKKIKKDLMGTNNTFAAIKYVDIKISELHALEQTLTNVMLRAVQGKQGWNVALVTPTIQGQIVLSKNKDVIHGEFDKLYFAENKHNIGSFDPSDLPPLQFSINDFKYGNKSFNHVEFVTNHKDGGLEIDKIIMSGPRFNINARGAWFVIGDKQKSFLTGKITSNDFGTLLKQWELTDNLANGAGVADFSLEWLGAPYNPGLKTMTGSFTIKVGSGRIIHLGRKTENELGFGRILNMLSLQTIPRRLTLDFSDLVKDGFSFDTMNGNLTLARGNAIVKNIDLDGPVAQVNAFGKIGLVNKDYDIKLSTTPHITSSIPVIATIAGGPVAGMLSLVADKIISSKINKVTTYVYHITGLWANPQVEKI